MSNGQMLLALQKELEKDVTQPAYVRYLIAAMIETANKQASTNEKLDCFVEELKKDIATVSRKVDDLSTQTKYENEKVVTWPYIWKTFGVPIIVGILTSAITWLIAIKSVVP